MKKLLFLTLGLLLSGTAFSQILNPVKWTYSAKKISKTEAIVYLKANIDKGWHIYSQSVGEGGPIPTHIKFSPSSVYRLVGKTIEPKPITKFEKSFNMNVNYFENTVTFQQKINLASSAPTVKGKLEFMVCSNSKCLPPDEVEFVIPVK
ncbi:MAG: sugar transporter [Sphingobacteriales bacterium]|nr:sugar transporter [Sphingobacteriales bacterium]